MAWVHAGSKEVQRLKYFGFCPISLVESQVMTTMEEPMSLIVASREPVTAKPAKRFSPTETIKVTAKTIGTSLKYEMPISNISETGMLVTWNEVARIPFQINTILEVSLHKRSENANQSLTYLAKVVHSATQTDGSRGYGLKIIQSDDEATSEWVEMVKRISMNPETPTISL